MDKQKGDQRVVVLSNLNCDEKERFYQFLIANDVEFVLGNNGNFVARVRVVRPIHEGSQQMKSFAARIGGPQGLEDRTSASPLPTREGFSKDGHTTGGEKEGPQAALRREPQRILSGLAKKYPAFCELLQPVDHVPKPVSAANLCRHLDAIYDARYHRDTAKIKMEANGEIFEEESQNDKFPAFVFQYFSGMYGLKRILTQTSWRFASSIDKWRRTNPQVAMFAFFFEESLSSKELLFYLFARDICENELEITPLNRNNKRQVMLTGAQATSCLGEIFASHDDLLDRTQVLIGSSAVSLNIFLFTTTMEYYRSRTGAEGHELFAEAQEAEAAPVHSEDEVEAMVKRLNDIIGYQGQQLIEVGQIRLWAEELLKRKWDIGKMSDYWDKLDVSEVIDLKERVKLDKVKSQLSTIEEKKRIDSNAAGMVLERKDIHHILKMPQDIFRLQLETNIRTILRIRVQDELKNLMPQRSPVGQGGPAEFPEWCREEAVRELIHAVDSLVNSAITQNKDAWCKTLSLDPSQASSARSFQIICDKIHAQARSATTPAAVDAFVTAILSLPEVSNYAQLIANSVHSKYTQQKELAVTTR